VHDAPMGTTQPHLTRSALHRCLRGMVSVACRA
jgi:hypothetical protein